MSIETDVKVRDLQVQVQKLSAGIDALVERIEALEASAETGRADNAVVEGSDIGQGTEKRKKANR